MKEKGADRKIALPDQALSDSSLFRGLSASEVRTLLGETPHVLQYYEKEETIFHLMDPAERIGIVLSGRVKAQKAFPNGSQINVSTRGPGGMLGPAAAFSESRVYPCDVVALESSTILMFRREDLLRLLQKDLRILENFTTGISSAAYYLQQRIELYSYHGISQKAAFWLLIECRKRGSRTVPVPGSVTQWALLMNVSRPSLHRELKKMEETGLIRCTDKKVDILDPEALQDLLSG